MISFTFFWVSAGFISRMSAAIPETKGQASEVPLTPFDGISSSVV